VVVSVAAVLDVTAETFACGATIGSNIIVIAKIAIKQSFFIVYSLPLSLTSLDKSAPFEDIDFVKQCYI
jgi:hypothetical protein